MHITLIRQNTTGSEQVTCTLPDSLAQTRPTVLLALKFIQAKQLPDLAYRYGCRDGLCGVCTLNVNGRPKLACRAKVKENDLLSALDTLPVVKDFVVRRDHINKAVRQQIPVRMEKHSGESEDYSALHKLNKCIECYACLSGCSLHAKNKTPGGNSLWKPLFIFKNTKSSGRSHE